MTVTIGRKVLPLRWKWKMGWTLLILAIATINAENCFYDKSTKRADCSVGVLQDLGNGTVTSESRARHLVVTCTSNNHFHESILRKHHFGYLPDLKKLEIKNCKIRKIPDHSFRGLDRLEELNIQSHISEWSSMVMELERDAFFGLNSLQILNLTHNNIWTLPEACFCGLSSLRFLNMSKNYLQDVNDLGFGSSELNLCWIPLRVLDLSFNGFTKINHKALGQLKKLEELDLNSNQLNVIDDGALGELSSLTKLDLSNNHLVALPPDLFSGLSHLQTLNLQNNSLSVLAPGLFKDLEHLWVLNLSKNEISDEWLNVNTFSSLIRLVALDLSCNQLNEIDQTRLTSLSALQDLDLSHNNLGSVTSNTFVNQRNLHTLKLAHNNIEKLHPLSLSGLNILNTLSLNNNRLKKIHGDVLRNCTGLRALMLSGNSFRRIPNGLRVLKNLRTIDLSSNQIEKLDEFSFNPLNSTSLYGLSLAGNGIEELQASYFKLIPTLEVLNLANNRIKKLEQGVFNEVKQLRMLRLDSNRLRDIDGILLGLTQLQWLNVSANKLQWFDYAFIPRNLEFLDLHANHIEELQNYYKLGKGFKLKKLDVSSNRIKSVDSKSLIVSLEVVHLGSNEISSVGASAFHEMPHLRTVDLTSNQIRQLPLSALSLETTARTNQGGQQTPEFFLGGNPFICDCEMEWLQRINTMAQHRQHAKVMDLDNVECRLNDQHGFSSPVAIMQVQRKQFLCQYQAHCFALCMCCDFFACDCRMQCPEGCTCFHDATWSANVIQCSLRGHIDIPPLIPMDATSIYLDGNNFTGTLISQAFIGRKRVEALFLNNSQIAAISNQTFNGLTELEVLHLEDNLIQRLEGYEFGNLTSLRELYLERNQLLYVDDMTFVTLVSLEVLHLHNNRLVAYPAWELSSILPSLTAVTLSGNHWSCQCKFVHKLQVFAKEDGVVADLQHLSCRENGVRPLKVTTYLGENITCSDAMAVTLGAQQSHHLDIIPMTLGIAAAAIILITALVVLFVFGVPLKVWLHSKYGVRFMIENSNLGREKLYDAFISYSLKDEEFVNQILVSQLENPSHQMMLPSGASYKLCLEHRDLPQASSIADAFPGVSQLCAKHVLVVSRAYLESEWTQIRFAVKDFKKWRPVIILLEELSPLDLAAVPEFNLLLKTGTAVRWSDAGFWNKLRFYLPDPRVKTSFRQFNISNSNNIVLNGLSGGHGSNQTTPNHKQNNDIAASVGGYLQHQTPTVNGWQYDDGLLLTTSNDSSQASTRSTIAGGSPRTVVTTSGQTSGSSATNSDPVQVVANPLDNLNDPDYQTVHQAQMDHNQLSEHIYHTLDQEEGYLGPQMGNYNTLGKLDVMLPNGQMVPATLVRNHSGRVIPLVEVGSKTMHQPPMRNYQEQTGPPRGHVGKNRHFL